MARPATGNAVQIEGAFAGPHKWYVAIALCAAHLASMVDRFVMVLVAEPVRHALVLSDAQLGLLQGTGFALLYCAFALPLGSAADNFNRRNMIIGGLVFWSVATIAAAFTNSFETLFLTRVLVGMGEACLIPAAMSLLVAYFPPAKLARGTAIFGVGANLGYGLAFIGGGVILTLLTKAGGLQLPGGITLAPWQGVFFCAGLIAVPVLAMMAFVKEPKRAGDDQRVSLDQRLGAMWAGLRYICAKFGRYFPFLVAAAATSAAGYGLNSWSTSLWVRNHGVSPAEAGQYVGLIGLIFGPLGTISGGVLLDKLQSAGVRASPLLVLSAGAIVLVPIVCGFVLTPGPFWPFVFFALFSFQSFAMMPSTYVGMQILTPDAYRGVSASFNMMVYSLCGIGLGPPVVGIISDHLGAEASLGQAVIIFECCAAALIVATVFLSRSHYHRHASAVRAEAVGASREPAGGASGTDA